MKYSKLFSLRYDKTPVGNSLLIVLFDLSSVSKMHQHTPAGFLRRHYQCNSHKFQAISPITPQVAIKAGVAELVILNKTICETLILGPVKQAGI